MRKAKILILTVFFIFCLWAISDSAPIRHKFLSSDITVPINTTWVEGTNFTSKTIMLAYANNASITFYVKGNNAACSKDVIFKFVTFDSLRNKWDTVDIFPSSAGISVTANGTTAVQKTIAINPDFEKIKLLSVQNQETVSGYTVDVNVSIFVK
jgi:hypothetical protein